MYTSALYFVCGLIDPGFAITCPRSTSSFFVPRSSSPTLSPARPSSSSFLNISDRKSTRLNSSHTVISYAVFCLKKKKKNKQKINQHYPYLAQNPLSTTFVH